MTSKRHREIIRRIAYGIDMANYESNRIEEHHDQWTALQFLFHFAAQYRERGWSVIPLHYKRPAISSWQQFRVRRPSYAELRGWFGPRRNHRTTGIGIVTGIQSGLVVVDCDSSVDDQWWRNNFPSSPLTVQSGGGGSHHYYRQMEATEVRNRIRVCHRKIDVRGEGGYIVAPPSIHANGSAYAWETWDDYSLSSVPVFKPSWVRSSLNSCEIDWPQSLPSPQSRIHDIRAYIDKIQSVSGQGGHNACFRVACLLRDHGLTPSQASLEIQRWNKTHAQPPWNVKELNHKIKSAYNARRSSRRIPSPSEP